MGKSFTHYRRVRQNLAWGKWVNIMLCFISGSHCAFSRDSLWCAIVEQKQEDNWEYLHLLLDKAAVVSNNPRKCIKQKNIKEKHSSLGVDFS